MPSLQFVIPLFVILLLSLSFHEAAHAWTANRLGDPTARLLGRITLNPMAHIDWIGTVLFPLIAIFSGFPLLGWAKPVPVNFHNLRAPRRDFAIVAAAGPLSNLILATIVAGAMTLLGGFAVVLNTTAGEFFWQALRLNVLLAVFNMIPVPPLDGGNVLMGMLPESMARGVDALRPYGILILYALLFTGALETVIMPIANAITGWLLL